jgi:hypothetical protein
MARKDQKGFKKTIRNTETFIPEVRNPENAAFSTRTISLRDGRVE